MSAEGRVKPSIGDFVDLLAEHRCPFPGRFQISAAPKALDSLMILKRDWALGVCRAGLRSEGDSLKATM